MSHRFGNLLTQVLHRKHGLSQAKLAAGILQDPSIIAKMCKGERLNGPQARERIAAIIEWLFTQDVLNGIDEANALLQAAGHAPLTAEIPNEDGLIQRIRAKPDRAPVRISVLPPAGAHSAQLPRMPTPFVGRRHEIEHIRRSLGDDGCRLITLTGPGGIGKTRLAIQAAHDCAWHFSDGAHFVDLQPIADAAGMPYAIAGAFQIALSNNEPPLRQIQTYLANKRLLLLLDNVEHLLNAGAVAISDILSAAPNVKIIATSRQPLNVLGEWQYQVLGVECPPIGAAANADELSRYDAVRLFVECAKRVQPQFTLQAQGESVARICHVTEGLPLAIEMAAAWTKSLMCADIARELERSLAILKSEWHNAPARHRSMDAAFGHSWKMLNDQERRVFARLSVFRGGFTRHAAAHVVDARLDDLAALVNTSFLQLTSDNRYKIHELLRQYGEEQLLADAAEHRAAVERHCMYYAQVLSDAILHYWPSDQLAVLQLWRAEADNMRASWRRSIELKRFDAVSAMAAGIYWTAQLTSQYLEGYTALEQAATALAVEEESALIAKTLRAVLIGLAWLVLRLGQIDKAEAASNKCLTLRDAHDVSPTPMWADDPVAILSICSAVKANYPEAERLAVLARQSAEQGNCWWNIPVAGYAHASALLAQGKLEGAQQAIQESIGICRARNEKWFLAYCLNTLGDIAFARHDLAAAEHNYWAAYDLREQFHDAEGMALALKHLGDIALTTAKLPDARAYFERALALYHNLNDRGGLAAAQKGLGDVECAQNNPSAAALNYAQALHIAREISYVSLAISVLLACAALFLRQRNTDEAAALLALIARHPASDERNRAEARALAKQHQLQLPDARGEPDSGAGLDALIANAVERLRAIAAA